MQWKHGVLPTGLPEKSPKIGIFNAPSQIFPTWAFAPFKMLINLIINKKKKNFSRSESREGDFLNVSPPFYHVEFILIE